MVGTLSDYRGHGASKYVQVAKDAIDIADQVVFVGPWASRCLRAKRHPDDSSPRAFMNVKEAVPFLKRFLQPGDLVLLKGSGATEPLKDIIPAVRNSTLSSETDSKERRRSNPPRAERADPLQLVVGLGNPSADYDGTPHNIGKRVLDLLVEGVGEEWSREDDVMIARSEWNKQPVWFVKPMSAINATGPVLDRLKDKHGLAPRDVVLVQDDINLPIGTIRSRMKGSAGGHKGVASVITAFQTEAIRRVKVGVDQPARKEHLARYVTSPFEASLKSAVQLGCHDAADRVLQLIGDPNRGEHKQGKKKPAKGKAQRAGRRAIQLNN